MNANEQVGSNGVAIEELQGPANDNVIVEGFDKEW